MPRFYPNFQHSILLIFNKLYFCHVLNNFSLNAHQSHLYNFEIKNHPIIKPGIDFEVILPFNKNKWTFSIQPSISKFVAEQEIDPRIATIQYMPIDLPIGFRYYMFLNKTSKAYISGHLIGEIALNSNIEIQRISHYDSGIQPWEIRSDLCFALSAGYKYNNKITAELRYESPKDIINLQGSNEALFSTIGIVLGYSIF